MNSLPRKRAVRTSRLRLQLAALLPCLAAAFAAHAQFTVGGQVLQRSEYRSGYGRLIGEKQDPAFFIGHRVRLHAQYEHARARFHLSVQDARPWGAAGTPAAASAYSGVHEAWGELLLDPHWSLRLGRQELNYDEARFLGNLDWAFQARTHDFALLRFEKDSWKAHAGGGWNVGAESLADQPYAAGGPYKAAQFIRIERRWGGFTASAMLWNNGLEQHTLDSTGAIAARTIRYSQTFGLPTLRYERGRLALAGFAYGQGGQDIRGRAIEAYDAGLDASLLIPQDTARGSALRITLGAEALSGTPRGTASEVNRSYVPLFSTFHAWNGYMDHFYAGGRWNNGVGLIDLHLRLRQDLQRRTFLSLNVHEFHAAATVMRGSEELDSRLGTELDLTVGHLLNEVVSLQFGYSHLLPTATLELLEGVAAPAAVQNWAYLAILYRPGMKQRFAGLRF